jgi:hypothetical protein
MFKPVTVVQGTGWEPASPAQVTFFASLRGSWIFYDVIAWAVGVIR